MLVRFRSYGEELVQLTRMSQLLIIIHFTIHLSKNTACAQVRQNEIRAAATVNATILTQDTTLVANTQVHWLNNTLVRIRKSLSFLCRMLLTVPTVLK